MRRAHSNNTTFPPARWYSQIVHHYGGYIMYFNPLRISVAALLACFTIAIAVNGFSQTRDPLPSWNDGPNKQAIIDFVTAATTEGHPDFIGEQLRIATFDNDGTLWSEQPLYFQAIYIFDRSKYWPLNIPNGTIRNPSLLCSKVITRRHLQVGSTHFWKW